MDCISRIMGGSAAVVAAMAAVSCAVTREQKLERQADRVETALKSERDRVLALPASDERAARVDHLSSLRSTLSAANVARGLVPHLMEESQRELAYDILDRLEHPARSTEAAVAAAAGGILGGGVLNLDAAKPAPRP